MFSNPTEIVGINTASIPITVNHIQLAVRPVYLELFDIIAPRNLLCQPLDAMLKILVEIKLSSDHLTEILSEFCGGFKTNNKKSSA